METGSAGDDLSSGTWLGSVLKKERAPMKRHTKFFATTAIVTMATALPALALTPEEAWDNWVATTANFPGLEVTYDDPTSKNGGLSVADLQIQANEGDDVFTLTVPEFLIMEDGADAVTMTLPEDATVSMLVDGISMKFTLWNDDLVIGASDENGTVSNSISASAITFTLTEMMEGDTALDPLEIG